jgi:alpha-beta hydrolase superfamily lysophospholipase
MEKKVIQNRKGQKIVIIIEKSENKKGLVFVMHGLGGFKEQPQIKTIAGAFKEKGYTVIRFDTTNTVGESAGKLELATMTNYYEDLEDVIHWAQTHEWYQEPFCLAGHSLGSFCVSLYAENYPEKVRALAPISTVVSGELFIKAFKAKESLEEWERRGYRERESSSLPGVIKRVNYSFVSDILKYDLLKKIDKIKIPILLVVGEKDTDLLPESQKLLYNALNSEKELHIIKGAEHTFKENSHLIELKEIFNSWIERLNRF